MHLDDIHSPDDLKRADPRELEPLAEEIRRRIIDTVAKNGGHLASNLGMVELTIALHRAFDAPKDRLIFDVGHQCYAHKLLTGRQERFDTLRRFGGLAGFPRREESAYDAFNTGHASTAISAAVGFARARDLAGEDGHVVAVVGDGALTGGMCYEALSDAGSSGLRMIVVLNDNGMSISPNVGAVSRYLTRLRSGKGWFEAKRVISGFLKGLPAVGAPLYRLFHRFKDSLRNIFVQDKLFDALGFQYLGPVDGNDAAGLERLLRRAKELNGPVLIHAVTRKGLGYPQAEDHPTLLHGTPPFDVATGRPLAKGGAGMGAAAGEELLRLAEKDKRIVAVTAAMTESTGLGPFAKAYPGRLFDVGIAEEHAVAMAAGLAAGGARPFVAIYDTFLQRAYDQLLHDVCLQRLPVCFLIDRAGLSEDGATHHGIFGVSYLTQLPGMTVLYASGRAQLRAMIRYALRADGPVAIRYGKADAGILPPDREIASYAPRWERLREGTDAALIACGALTAEALAAAELLREKGLSCAVYEASCLSTVDADALREMNGLPLITVEEGILPGGLGSALSAYCAARGLPGPVLTLGLKAPCVTQGERALQLAAHGLDAAHIARSILERRRKE